MSEFEMHHTRTRAVLVIAGLLCAYFLLFCGFFWDGLWQGVAANYDTVYQFFPYRIFGVHTIAIYHQLPYWDPSQMLGVPLLADVQCGMLSPFNMLLLLGDAGIALNLMLGLHYALAGLGVWLYLRTWRVGTLPAFVAGAVFMLSGPMITQKEISTVAFAAAYWPWLFWAVERLCQTLRWRYVVALSVVVWLQIIDGHIEVCIYSCCYLAVYTLFRVAALPRARLAVLARLGAGVVAGLALAAPQLLLSASMVTQSLRSSYDLGYARSGQFTPIELLGLLYPYIEGHGWGERFYSFATLCPQTNLYRTIALYVGTAPLLIAVLAPIICRGAARRIVVFFWLTALLQIAFALGEYTPVHLLAFHLPVLGSFRHPDRATFQVALAVAVSVGIALHVLIQRTGYYRQVLSALAGAALVAAVVWLTAHAQMWNQVLCFPPWISAIRLSLPNVYIPLIFLVAAAAALTLCIWRPLRLALPWVIFLLWCVDMYAVARQFVPASELSYEGLRTAIAMRTPKGTTLSRTVSFSQTSMRVPAARMGANTFQITAQHPVLAQYATFPLLDWVVFAGVRDAGIIHDYRFFHAHQFFRHADVRFADYCDAYFNKPVTLATGARGFEAPDCLGRVFLTTNVIVFPNLASIAEAVCSNQMHWPTPDTVAVLMQDPALTGWSDEFQGDATGTCALLEYTPSRVLVRAQVSAPMLLVLGDYWYGDWHATLNGQPVPIVRVDGMLRGVLLPAGEHRVVFFYRSSVFLYGCGILGLAVLFLCLMPRFLRNRATALPHAHPRGTHIVLRVGERVVWYTGFVLMCLALIAGLPEQGLRFYRTPAGTNVPSYVIAPLTKQVLHVTPQNPHAIGASFYSNVIYGMSITASRLETNTTPCLLFDCMNGQWDLPTAEIYKQVTTRPRRYRAAFIVETNQVRSCIRLLCMETNGTISVQNATVGPIGPLGALAINVAKNLTPFYSIWLVLVIPGTLYLIVMRTEPFDVAAALASADPRQDSPCTPGGPPSGPPS